MLQKQFQAVFADQVPSLLLYYPLCHYGMDREVKTVYSSPLIEPADRFRHIADWYIKTRRITVQEQSRVRQVGRLVCGNATGRRASARRPVFY